MSIADGSLTSIALCWRLERCDGAGIGLTSHDQPIVRDDISFEPTPGMNPASIVRGLGLEPNSCEIAGALSSDAIDEGDLELGRWDAARVQLTAYDWGGPTELPIELLAGEVGAVSIKDEAFTADLLGAAVKLEAPVCPATSAECRAHFGDKDCRVDLAGRSLNATVVSVDGGSLTVDQAVDDRFVLGRLRYMSGANCGKSTVILTASGRMVGIRDLPRGIVEAGCRVELREACDKRFATCVSRFDNAANFRGEPHLPGNDLLTRYPGA
jgi:uncharacterized phage protein (TIGR02218 family)